MLYLNEYVFLPFSTPNTKEPNVWLFALPTVSCNRSRICSLWRNSRKIKRSLNSSHFQQCSVTDSAFFMCVMCTSLWSCNDSLHWEAPVWKITSSTALHFVTYIEYIALLSLKALTPVSPLVETAVCGSACACVSSRFLYYVWNTLSHELFRPSNMIFLHWKIVIFYCKFLLSPLEFVDIQ